MYTVRTGLYFVLFIALCPEDRHKKLEQTGAGLESNLARDTAKKVGGTWRGSGAKCKD